MNRDAEIFAEAIDLPAAERAAFLDRACAGDPALRQRVELLLAGYAAAGTFMESPPAEALEPPPGERIGSVIGRYTLVRKLGEGGCGTVYLAEQQQPVRRSVALKIIKLGMDTRDVITRFEAERQALALMDHPDIARVFDAGATDTGRPYFVMEYVDGLPIAKFCDEHNLDMAARLELFARVCVALQHAHQKGIIHRDLKPSNILVALRDGVAAPKIIDFGIAKATQGRLTEQTLLTSLDHPIGTPAYMSPEQAELRELDIDTRSDVYSLGVVLYELLTGRPPYDPKSLVRAGLEEIRRIIRDVEPPKPSTCLSTLDPAGLTTIARLRGAAPAQLRSALRGDLDWIVMRCLEKDRARRYGTAAELAEDVRRHLRSEPVTARPPHPLYRARKFVARHRLACASAAAIAAALVAGTIVSSWQAIRARRAETAAQAERAEAQRQREQAETLVTFMLGDYRADVKKLGKLDLLDAVNDRALAYFAAFDLKTLSDVALTQQAKALYQIGETRIEQARYNEATAAFTSSYQRALALTTRHPRNADMLFERAQAEYWLGFLGRRRGDFEAAHTWLTRYRDATAALFALEGKTPRAQRELISGQHNLAVVEFDRRNLTAAQTGFLAEKNAISEMVAADPNNLDLRHRLADIASWLGRVAETEGRYADAVVHSREMSSRIEELIAREPAVARWKHRHAESLFFIAYSEMALGHRSESDALFVRAQAGYDALATLDQKNKQWQRAALSARLFRSALLLAEGDTSTAAPLIDAARGQLETMVAAEPDERLSISRLIAASRLEGRLRHDTGRPDALVPIRRAIALGEQVLSAKREDNWSLWDFSQSLLLAGRIEQSRGQSAAARQHWDRAIAVLAPRIANSPNEWRFLDPLAQSYVLTGQLDAANPLIERLKRFGYRPIDPLAASTLGIAR